MKGPTKADPGLDEHWLAYARKHPLRAQLLTLERERRRSWPEAVGALKQPPALVAYHWQVLKAAGLL